MPLQGWELVFSEALQGRVMIKQSPAELLCTEVLLQHSR